MAAASRVRRALNLLKFYVEEPDQKGEKWLERRSKCITGSVCDDAIKYRTRFIKNKLDERRGISSFKGNDATRFGERYEPISSKVNENYLNIRRKRHVKVYPAKFTPHEQYEFLGVSPDGIVLVFDASIPKTEDLFSLEYLEELYTKGFILDAYIMEYKNPYTRKPIAGEIPKKYLSQVQLQLEVVDVEKCMFVDTLIKECTTKEELLKVLETEIDNPWTQRYYGVLLQIVLPIEDVRKKYVYHYPSFYCWQKKKTCTPREIIDLMENECKDILQAEEEKRGPFEAHYFHYWTVSDMCMVDVERDKEWFSKVVDELRDVHEEIERMSSNEYFDVDTDSEEEQGDQ